MRDRPPLLTGARLVAAGLALVAIVIWILVVGPGLFSPGSLSAQASGQRQLGGVGSHAQLAHRCGACHVAPWSSQTMTGRCLACHTNVATEIQGHSGIHGALVSSSSSTCKDCHSDHHGANGALTTRIDHNAFPFKLTGKHADVPCQGCHTHAASIQDLRNTPQDCYSCHAKNDPHNGTFGTSCGQCHTTAGWGSANFNHAIFPVNHGTDKQASTCKTCHPTNFSTYTCLGCHAHTPSSVQAAHEGRSVASLQDCIRCHAGGKSGGD